MCVCLCFDYTTSGGKHVPVYTTWYLQLSSGVPGEQPVFPSLTAQLSEALSVHNISGKCASHGQVSPGPIIWLQDYEILSLHFKMTSPFFTSFSITQQKPLQLNRLTVAEISVLSTAATERSISHADIMPIFPFSTSCTSELFLG